MGTRRLSNMSASGYQGRLRCEMPIFASSDGIWPTEFCKGRRLLLLEWHSTKNGTNPYFADISASYLHFGLASPSKNIVNMRVTTVDPFGCMVDWIPVTRDHYDVSQSTVMTVRFPRLVRVFEATSCDPGQEV
jgi:hypothetical protein